MLAWAFDFCLNNGEATYLFLLAGKNNVKKCLPKIIEGKQLWSFGQCNSRDGFPLSQQAVV